VSLAEENVEVVVVVHGEPQSVLGYNTSGNVQENSSGQFRVNTSKVDDHLVICENPDIVISRESEDFFASVSKLGVELHAKIVVVSGFVIVSETLPVNGVETVCAIVEGTWLARICKGNCDWVSSVEPGRISPPSVEAGLSLTHSLSIIVGIEYGLSSVGSDVESFEDHVIFTARDAFEIWVALATRRGTLQLAAICNVVARPEVTGCACEVDGVRSSIAKR